MRLNPFIAGIAAIIGIFTLMAFAGSFYTVDEGERGVIVSQGKITGVAQPGLHLKTPFLDDVHHISVRTQALEFIEEPVYTADRQTANVTFSVNYAAIPTDNEIITLYREYKSLEGIEARILKRQIKDSIKNTFGQFTADTAVRERSRLNTDLAASVASLGDKLVRIEGVNIENINFSDAVERAAEERAKAEMNVNTKEQERRLAEKTAAITVIEAQAAADSKLAIATADADAVRLKGEAEAAAIKAKSDALRDNPNLVELTKAENWNGALPTNFVPGSATPFLKIQ